MSHGHRYDVRRQSLDKILKQQHKNWFPVEHNSAHALNFIDLLKAGQSTPINRGNKISALQVHGRWAASKEFLFIISSGDLPKAWKFQWRVDCACKILRNGILQGD